MLHPEVKFLEMFPLLGLLPIIQKDVRLGRIGGGPNTDPVGAAVFHLLIGARLDAPDKLFDGLERHPVAQKQVDEGGEPPVVIQHLPSSRLASTTAARCPDFVFLSGNAVLPRPTLSKEPGSDPVNAVDRALDLRLRVDGGAHHTSEHHHADRPPRLSWDRSRRSRTEPRRGRRTINR